MSAATATMPAAEIEAPPPTKPNGKHETKVGSAGVVSEADPIAQSMQRLLEIEKLGNEVQAKQGEIGTQETIVAQAKSKLDADRDVLNERKRELEDLQEDLANLARGGHPERLPFGKAQKPAAAGKGAAVAADEQTAFNAASLSDIGIAGAMKDKLEADGIRTGAELQKWFGGHPRRPIKGIGEGAIDKLSELMASWYERRQTVAAKSSEGAVPVAEAMGKVRRFKGNRHLKAKSKKK